MSEMPEKKEKEEKEEKDDSKEVKVDGENQTGNMDLIGPFSKRSYFRKLGIRL